MGLIKNFEALAKTPQRKIVLKLIEEGLAAIQPEKILGQNLSITDNVLKITDKTFNLVEFEKVYLLGFGKGSARISKLIENLLGDKLTTGFVIDGTQENFSKIKLTIGTHPLPSQVNANFTQNVIDNLIGTTEKDLIIIVICGGGSAMFALPQDGITLDEKIEVNRQLLKSGATIEEMNIVRKHLSKVKGGGLAKILHPATVAGLIFSDVPGNDFSTIASGPITKDRSTVEEAKNIIERYALEGEIVAKLTETPKEDKYFENVSTFLMLSNQTALTAMVDKAKQLGIGARIYSDKFQDDARQTGQKLLTECQTGEILLAGGETTLHVTGNGIGGRNLEVVLNALRFLGEGDIIASFDSDGWDNCSAAGAIGDMQTVTEAKKQNLTAEPFLNANNSLEFFQKTADTIITDRLPSNVSDIIVVYKS